MNLTVSHLLENREKLETTVLFREGGSWDNLEVSRFVNNLMTETCQHSQFPEYLILYGYYTKKETLEALLGGIAYTATQHVGVDKLPFSTGWVN